ncbi:Myb-like DNA-binding domain containing protein [Tritrichomonas foetus]|uniref:Myb-like DNA-binding domain containing protein n=1 Tax=Tritrichomonas foetus TaxID=1144522 RepID=A0A1J4K4N4_9EUKA|nr:Myb-like DNA-binding domain containing protein [Tritrichomonas foetus]|eukprot:OHT06155.1 Myb-like DNA-binding domain containing protein [Tritrichomonas foetus]
MSRKRLAHERLRHCAFSHEEDACLKLNIDQLDTNAWNKVADNMKRRSARQCKERYYVLTRRIESSRTWTKEEDLLLYNKCIEFGPKWHLLEAFFVDRNSQSLKNRWYKLQSKAEYDSLMTFATEEKKKQQEIEFWQTLEYDQDLDPTELLTGDRGQIYPVMTSHEYDAIW